MGRPLQAVAVLALLIAAPAKAQETIASDRPGIGSGAYVLGPGIFQLETGAELASTGTGHQVSLGQVVVRYGLSAFELQLLANSLVLVDRSANDDGIEDIGLQDLGVGVKVPLARGGPVADVALQGIVTAPTAASGVPGSAGPTTTVNLLADLSLTDGFALSVNGGVTRVFDEVAAATTGTLIVTPAVSLSDAVGLYGGWAGFFGEGQDDHVLEAGLTFLASRDTQLDVNGGWDARDPGSVWFFGVGVARRWGAR